MNLASHTLLYLSLTSYSLSLSPLNGCISVCQGTSYRSVLLCVVVRKDNESLFLYFGYR